MRYSGQVDNLVQPRDGDVGFDLRADETIQILPGEQRFISTGVILEIPHGYFGFVRDRSSIAALQLYVQAGVIDPSYRGEVQVVLSSHALVPYLIEKGDRIAQLILVPAFVPPLKYVSPVDGLTETKRGQKGFGSTGRR